MREALLGRFYSEIEATMVRDILAAAGIPSRSSMNSVTGSFGHHSFLSRSPDYAVFVPEGQLASARKALLEQLGAAGAQVEPPPDRRR